jgi:hypothetical protein
LRALWPGYSFLAIAPFVIFPLTALARGAFRWDHGAVLVLVPLLAIAGHAGKKVFVGAYPIGLVGIVYDTMGLVRNVGLTPERVHLCDLRAIDMSLFGITVDGTRMTLHDWFVAHDSTPWDVFFSVPYGTFIAICLGFAFWAYFKDFTRMQRYTWGFLALNLLGFATYHVYPAAPPWYFHAHGCTVDLMSHASEGTHLARVDALFGVPYFAGMYGRSTDVFGAVPSLHVAYPTLILLEGWGLFGRVLRAASVSFVVWMAAAAVYLDHHWVTDAIMGFAYAVVVFAVMRVVFRRVMAARSASAQAPPVEVVS